MNGEGDFNDPGVARAYLRGEYVTGIDFGDPFPGGYYPDISMGFFPALPQTFFELPPILPGPPPGGDGSQGLPTAGDSALPEIVVDPDLGTATTVFESAVDAPTATRTRETDWDWVYDRYVILNPPTQGPEFDVPFHETIDWGEVAGGILGGVLDPFGVGAAARSALAGPPAVVGGSVAGVGYNTLPLPQVTAGAVMEHGCPPYGPKYAKICLATNQITPLRRRRRRRLLTSSDIKDLAALKAIVGGAALQGAVVQAIRR